MYILKNINFQVLRNLLGTYKIKSDLLPGFPHLLCPIYNTCICTYITYVDVYMCTCVYPYVYTYLYTYLYRYVHRCIYRYVDI